MKHSSILIHRGVNKMNLLIEYATVIDTIFFLAGAAIETLLVVAIYIIYKNRKKLKKDEKIIKN